MDAHSDCPSCQPQEATAIVDKAGESSGPIEQISQLVNTWQQRPSWDEYFMATAILIASRSSCTRLKVGCVLVSAGEHAHRIIAAGYNGFLAGAPHTSRVRDGHEQATVHAEQNAISDAAKRGISVQGATAYITHYPCVNCAKILISAGVRSIKYNLDYKNDSIVHELLIEAAVDVQQL